MRNTREYSWSNPLTRRNWGYADGYADGVWGQQRQHTTTDPEYLSGYRGGYEDQRKGVRLP